MTAGVFGQVVAAHEAPVAHGAHELLLSRVRPPVARQLVRASELLVTAVPAAAEGLLTCVCSEVSLEVGALEVGLPTAGEGAHVVPAAGEVHLGGAAGPGGNIDRGGGQR